MGGVQFEGGTFPLVSVIIPCYNSSEFIEKAIQSAITQDYPNKEVIVINDGSTDDSLKKIQGFQQVHVINQENRGVSNARNEGIKKAKGKYIAFLDADDEFLPQNLSKKVRELEDKPNHVLVHSPEEIRKKGKKMGTSTGKGGPVTKDLLLLEQTVIHSPSSVLLRREVLSQAGDFDEKLSTSADWDLWLRLSAIGSFSYIEEVLSIYNLHENQMHLNVDTMAGDMNHALEKAMKSGIISTKRDYNRYRSNLHLTIAASYYGDSKRPIPALRYSLSSFFASPSVFWKRIFQKAFKK